MPIHHKLVRDRIPEIIERSGKTPHCRTLSHNEYLTELDRKLNEECAEYQADKSLEELADMLEVMYTIAEARGYSVAELEQVRAQKNADDALYAKGEKPDAISIFWSVRPTMKQWMCSTGRRKLPGYFHRWNSSAEWMPHRKQWSERFVMARSSPI